MAAIGYTVYDSELDTGNVIPGGFIVAFVVESRQDADVLLAKYSENPKRYDVRTATMGAVADVAMQIAERINAERAL